DDALAMGGIERIRDLDGQAEKLGGGKRSPRNKVIQGSALQKLHSNKVLSLEFVNFVDGADVRVVEGRCSPRFPLEPLQRARIPFGLLREKFEGYPASQADVLGLINDAHASGAELPYDPVMRYGLADHWRRCLVRMG